MSNSNSLFEAAFDVPTASMAFKITNQQAMMLQALMRDKLVSRETLSALVSNVHTSMSRLRAALSPYGVLVHTRPRMGYYLTLESKAHLRRIYKGATEAVIEGVDDAETVGTS